METLFKASIILILYAICMCLGGYMWEAGKDLYYINMEVGQ
jgi:hypothetical protein